MLKDEDLLEAMGRKEIGAARPTSWTAHPASVTLLRHITRPVVAWQKHLWVWFSHLPIRFACHANLCLLAVAHKNSHKLCRGSPSTRLRCAAIPKRSPSPLSSAAQVDSQYWVIWYVLCYRCTHLFCEVMPFLVVSNAPSCRHDWASCRPSTALLSFVRRPQL